MLHKGNAPWVRCSMEGMLHGRKPLTPPRMLSALPSLSFPVPPSDESTLLADLPHPAEPGGLLPTPRAPRAPTPRGCAGAVLARSGG